MRQPVKYNNVSKYDLNLVVIAIVSTTVLILEYYYSLPDWFPEITPLFFYMAIPLIIGFLLFREKPADYGIRLGNWKLSLAFIVVSLSLMAAAIYIVSDMQSFEDYYRVSDGTNWGTLFIETALYMFAWEFIFRGYMLFGLEKSLGINAIFIQAIPFALLHIGKPELEAVTTFFGGCILGYISYRTRSFLPCFVIHFWIYMMTRFFFSY